MAFSKLASLAVQLPAWSKAVPWSTEVRMIGKVQRNVDALHCFPVLCFLIVDKASKVSKECGLDRGTWRRRCHTCPHWLLKKSICRQWTKHIDSFRFGCFYSRIDFIDFFHGRTIHFRHSVDSSQQLQREDFRSLDLLQAWSAIRITSRTRSFVARSHASRNDTWVETCTTRKLPSANIMVYLSVPVRSA